MCKIRNDRYLFKAKRIDNGEWEIGHLMIYPNGETRMCNACKNPPDSDPMWEKALITHDVDPSTICQCTGLRDKNDNLIWENDIVKFDVYYYEKLQSSIISQIKWCNALCALSLVVNGRGTRGTLGHLMDLNKEIEVIGNIFDNPELLSED